MDWAKEVSDQIAAEQKKLQDNFERSRIEDREFDEDWVSRTEAAIARAILEGNQPPEVSNE